MHRVLGIDPGINGGAAIVSIPDFKLIDAIELPTRPDGKRRILDAFPFMCWVLHHRVTKAAIENVQPMPSFDAPKKVKPKLTDEDDDDLADEAPEPERRGMGSVSAFRYGGAVIGARLILNCAKIEPRLITAQTWKQRYGLGRDKNESRRMASYLYPHCEEQFERVKDANKAEAVLIARYEAEMIAGYRPNLHLTEFHRRDDRPVRSYDDETDLDIPT